VTTTLEETCSFLGYRAISTRIPATRICGPISSMRRFRLESWRSPAPRWSARLRESRRTQSEQGKRELEIALRLDRSAVSARYAQAMLSGDAADPGQMLKLGRELLAPLRAAIARKPEQS
jgi:hypothetical protein